MATIIRAIARSPWRVNVSVDATFAGITTAATYAFTRADVSQTTVAVRLAFTTDPLSIELALTEALQERAVYVLSASGASGTAQFSYQSPAPPPAPGPSIDDPEAEAFGVDIDWEAESFDASGDTPEVRGIDCLKHDLVAIARTSPGELFHRPTRGAGLSRRVNAPSDPSQTQASVLREWTQDDRVQSIQDAQGKIPSAGGVVVSATIIPVALPSSPLPMKVTNG